MPPLSVWMVRAALLHLGMGFTFGALMLFDKAVSFYPEVWRLWSIHVEVTLIGWIVQIRTQGAATTADPARGGGCRGRDKGCPGPYVL